MAEPVQALWVKGELPLMQRLSIASFLAQGHEYHLYTYDPALRAPAGTVVCDASRVLDASRVFRDRHGWGAFSDCFRYRLLLLRGGWWVDTDFICMRPFEAEAGYVFASERLPEGGYVPTSGVIKAPAGAAAMEYADRVCAEKDKSSVEWAELGPALLGKAIERFSLEAHVATPETYCPVPWFRFRDVIDPAMELRFGAETRAVHLWHAMWGRRGFNPNAAYHPASAYEGWKREFLSRHMAE